MNPKEGNLNVIMKKEVARKQIFTFHLQCKENKWLITKMLHLL